MTMTRDRRELYPTLPDNEVKAIDEAYSEAVHALKQFGINVAGDDRAENLVGAIARFVEDSRS